MEHETDPGRSPAVESSSVSPDPEVGAAPANVPALVAPMSWRALWLGAAGIAIVAACLVLFFSSAGRPTLRASNSSNSKLDNGAAAGIPVNTVRPRKKTLERVLVLPGSIQPGAQAELYAKASGYLKRIQRESNDHSAMAPGVLLGRGSFVAYAPAIAAALHVLKPPPQKDIGSWVRAGEVLLEIDAPERLQDVVEKESLLKQRQAELAAARTALGTLEAAVIAATAHTARAQAEVRKSESEHSFRIMELNRLKKLAQSATITPELVDEKQNQVNAAFAALESSKAQVQVAQGDLAVASAKLAAARADLNIREAQVQVARDALRQTQIIADYCYVRAPFDGVITYRGVDEGDFIQNASSGQSRRLMTITAIGQVKVVLHVPESDAPWVRVGTDAIVVLDARAGSPVKGRVARIAHVLDSETRTMQAEIDLENRYGQLLPGMYGQVTLDLQKIPDAQAIPATALYSRRGENYILQVDNGIAHKHRVRIRYDDGKEVEVVKQLAAREVPLQGSEELIVSNKGEIAEGQRVRTSSLAGH